LLERDSRKWSSAAGCHRGLGASELPVLPCGQFPPVLALVFYRGAGRNRSETNRVCAPRASAVRPVPPFHACKFTPSALAFKGPHDSDCKSTGIWKTVSRVVWPSIT